MLPFDILSIIISYLDKNEYHNMAKYLKSEGIDIYTIYPSSHFIVASYHCTENLYCITTLFGNYFIDIAIGQIHISCNTEYRDDNYIVNNNNGKYIYEMEEFKTHIHNSLHSNKWKGAISPFDMHELHISPSLVECKDGSIVLIIDNKTYKLNKDDYILIESKYLLYGDYIIYPHLNVYSHIPIIRKLGFKPMDIKKIRFSTLGTDKYIVVIFNSDPNMIHVFFTDTNTHCCQHKEELHFDSIRIKNHDIYLYDIMSEEVSKDINPEKKRIFDIKRYNIDSWGKKTSINEKRSRKFTVDLETDLYNVNKIIRVL